MRYKSGSGVCGRFVEEAHRQQTIPDCTARAKCRGDKYGLCNLLASGACLNGILDMRIDTVCTLGRQGNSDRNQLPVLFGDDAVFAFRSVFEVEERAASLGANLMRLSAYARS